MYGQWHLQVYNRSNQRRGGVQYTFCRAGGVVGSRLLLLLGLLLFTLFFSLPACLLACLSPTSVSVFPYSIAEKQLLKHIFSFLDLWFRLVQFSQKEDMARLFSVPRQIGGGAGLTRLFAQRPQQQLRLWFVHSLLLLFPFHSKTNSSRQPHIRGLQELISRQLRLYHHS